MCHIFISFSELFYLFGNKMLSAVMFFIMFMFVINENAFISLTCIYVFINVRETVCTCVKGQ